MHLNRYIQKFFVYLTMLYFMTMSSSLLSFDKKNTLVDLTSEQLQLLKESVIPIKNKKDYTPLINLASQKRIISIADSTHGTHEFYQQRIELSKLLIKEKKYKLIVIEGDWPNVYMLNQYIQSDSPYSENYLLKVFNPYATWLWNNYEMLDFIQWLKHYNASLPEDEQKVSLYGMDIYSFDQSRKAVVDYLKAYSHKAAKQALHRYQCFNAFNNDLHSYGRMSSKNPSSSCEKAVNEQYQAFEHCLYPCPEEFPFIDRDAWFNAAQNARVVKNTERSLRLYYTNKDEAVMWNERDRHMLETLEALFRHLYNPKTIIWAHSSHLGDARVTIMSERGQINLGQLLRERFNEQVFSIGFLTYSGQVLAADETNRPARLKQLLPAHPESNEALFHRLKIPVFYLNLSSSPEVYQLLNRTRLQRHVGVVYRPQIELEAHYSETLLSQQFDVIIYLDQTSVIRRLN